MSAAALQLGNIPFYWRMLDTYDADRLGIPDLLPLALAFRPDLQLVIQRENPQVLEWLQRVYRENANVGYLQEGHALSQSYGNEFLRFLDQVLGHRASMPGSAMEVGCGGMYLLKMLRDRGMDVCGIDPSPVSGQQARRAGITLIEDFFPSQRITRKADLLFHHNVLEHVSDPVAFLKAHHANLNPGGQVVTAVPDCSECIEGGDVSMVIHEHLAYFDADSLARTFAAAGFQDIQIGRSRFGGVLYGSGRAAEGAGAAAPASPGSDDKFVHFCERAGTTLARFRDYARQAADSPHGAGFYVPLRAIPYLSACGISGPFRFFDDDPGIHGKYFAGVDVPVENFDDLAARPVSRLLVCSFSFGEKIAARVRQHFGPRVQVTLLQDLVTPAAASSGA